MARRRIIITRADHQHLEDLFIGSLAETFRDKPYLDNLRAELDVALVVESGEVPPDVITLNSTTRLRDMETSETEIFTLVFPNEASIAEGKLSILAPLGTAILGYRVGDSVHCHVPSGVCRWRVEELTFQPERDSVAA